MLTHPPINEVRRNLSQEQHFCRIPCGQYFGLDFQNLYQTIPSPQQRSLPSTPWQIIKILQEYFLWSAIRGCYCEVTAALPQVYVRFEFPSALTSFILIWIHLSLPKSLLSRKFLLLVRNSGFPSLQIPILRFIAQSFIAKSKGLPFAHWNTLLTEMPRQACETWTLI